MSYLIQSDFKKSIQTDNLNQVIGSDTAVLQNTILTAVEEAKSYLVQKYDTSAEFAQLTIYDPTLNYNANARVYLDGPLYNPVFTYALSTVINNAGSIYICTTAVTVGEAFNITKWALLGLQFAIFYVPIPQPQFVLSNLYNVGDAVFYKNKTYICQQATAGLDHATFIQFANYQNVPYSNVFPDASTQAWGVGTAYTKAAGTLPTGWTAGDNRTQQMVMYCIDITLYHVHCRIAPRNIPDLRAERYHAAIKWLEGCASGKITPALPVLQPLQGGRIRYGGKIKQENSY
jgi:phage gp36-like protein